MKNLIFTIMLMFSTASFANTQEYNVCWSIYVGWMPWEYANQSGILKKHADKHGVKINLKQINTYMASIEQYSLNPKPVKDDPCVALTVTNMDALTAPALAGVDTEVIVVGDFSNGNDAILSNDPTVTTPAHLKGKTIAGVQFSVSHYLLSRALKMNSLTEREVTFKNTDEAEIPNFMRAGSSKKDAVSVTWNPWKKQIMNEGAKTVFDSSQIPGEIIDTLVVKTSAPDALKKALVGAWYETMAVMSANPPKQNSSVAAMAQYSGGTLEDFLYQLDSTQMFYEASKAVAFTSSPSLKNTMNYIRTFSYKAGIYPQGKDADYVGIEFPDKSVEGDKNNVRLRFNSAYMQMAADGKL